MLSLAAKAAPASSGVSATLKRGSKIDFVGREKHLKLVDGWAASFVEVSTDCRQITAIHLPGDVVNAPIQTGPLLDIGVLALSDMTIAPCNMDEVFGAHASVQREQRLMAWMVNIACRTALERIAHLLCELQKRVSNIAGTDILSFKMPLLQEQIGDATGMTAVHANRMIQELRRLSLARITHGTATIADLPGLRRLAGFDGRYLEVTSS